MHLLVLGAFWRMNVSVGRAILGSLNAPSGAGCFLAGFICEVNIANIAS